eukprot:TRINITY_DN2113_c0_g1_i3.p1 TRINITY_DN2113_c0_g1~~TRINITY_DN2113_c0_g1_i3.p1  ORF type:complete len:394 (-),score=82.22 TRINITY_DN2113_c0_g1_i3:127-1308(-)
MSDQNQTTGSSNSSSSSSSKSKSFISPLTDEAFQQAAERIRAGQLVSFPTETVYGLGANALNADAVQRIYSTKRRPLSDPVILHVDAVDKALELLNLDEEQVMVFRALAGAFWPGPLTMVAEARPLVPSICMAGTGQVGVRCPLNQHARRLITESGCPIAAPSANRFGHVSPTCAQHVLDDFHGPDDDVMVLDGGSCDVGIESTVLQVGGDFPKLRLFRRGAVSIARLSVVLDEIKLPSGRSLQIEIVKKKQDMESAEANVAPGQLITHYAPDLPTYQASITSTDAERVVQNINDCVIIDFHGSLGQMKDNALYYIDISPNGDIAQAASGLFSALRTAETIADAKCVVITSSVGDQKEDGSAAVQDRIYRAASGKRAQVSLDGQVHSIIEAPI